ncbi:hypothetical protein D3C81_1984350 [compost metagenome]
MITAYMPQLTGNPAQIDSDGAAKKDIRLQHRNLPGSTILQTDMLRAFFAEGAGQHKTLQIFIRPAQAG